MAGRSIPPRPRPFTSPATPPQRAGGQGHRGEGGEEEEEEVVEEEEVSKTNKWGECKPWIQHVTQGGHSRSRQGQSQVKVISVTTKT